MSVLNQSGDEQVECPLCMEPLEVDDLNFFPCTCGYQICRFCWHRIRTDENGLCPACRKAYSENPADFTPLSKEQVSQLKAEKRQRDQQRKAKISESRKHLANVRVVQKNLVFVVGLPMRLADAEVLKRHEYFGKFGKIHKVVINQSTTYAGPQGPSASAYVTYMKSDDALRAIQSVNNITIDGRPIKSSLGTTKYCSHFMKNQPCPKPDCMYLHDFDPEASFTKEQMHTGKHQEYEKKLHETLLTKMQQQQQQQCGGTGTASSTAETKTTNSKSKDSNSGGGGSPASSGGGKDKEGWPTLSTDKKEGGKEKAAAVTQKGKKKKEAAMGDGKKTEKGRSVVKCSFSGTSGQTTKQTTDTTTTTTTTKSDKNTTAFSNKCVLGTEDGKRTQSTSKSNSDEISSNSSCSGSGSEKSSYSSLTKLPIVNDDSSFFSHNAFQKLQPDDHRRHHDDDSSLLSGSPDDQAHVLNDSMPNITSSEDWEAAFGFTKHSTTTTSHLDELAKHGASGVKDTLETFGGGFAPSPLASQPAPDLFETMQRNSFNSTVPNGGKHPSDNLLEALVNKQFAQNGMFATNKMAAASSSDRPFGLSSGHGSINGLNGLNGLVSNLNGLDRQMSKFFVDFYKNGHNKSDVFGSGSSGAPNGLSNLNGLAQQNGFLHNIADRQNLLYLQQKQIEEQLRSLSLAQQTYTAQQMLHNGLHNQFASGTSETEQQTGFGALGQHQQAAEDELDFDPFHETQKGLAELMEDEQNHKLLNAGRTSQQSQMNGLGHSQGATNNSLPPPPPGFIQSAHMNSFGSKILPFLNMNNSNQPQVNSTQNSWSPAAGCSQPQQNQQVNQKGTGSCNNELKDWKVLDPAIVSSSRHYQPLTSLHLRDRSLQQQQQQQHIEQRSPPLSSTSNSYGYNWVGGGELTAPISRPPGFRTTPNQTGKQQEC